MQIDRSTYFDAGYFDPRRFASYAHQLREIAALNVPDILEIGVGNGLVSHLLRNAGFDVTTVDFDRTLDPDIVGSVLNLPVRAGAVSAVACFQVLEHLPFADFGAAVSEIRRVAKKSALLSLPDCNRYCDLVLCLPKLGERRFYRELPLFRMPVHEFDGEHHWEINKAGYALSEVMRIIQGSGFRVTKTYRLREWSYHRMFVLDKV